MSESSAFQPLGIVSYGSGDCYSIAEGDANLDPRDVLEAFLWESGYDIDARSPEIVEEGLKILNDDILWSCVKADQEFIEDWEPGQYHTDGSGKRSKHCWWVDRRWIAYLDKIDAQD